MNKKVLVILLVCLLINCVYYIPNYANKGPVIIVEAVMDEQTQWELYYSSGDEPFSDERMIIGEWFEDGSGVIFTLPDINMQVMRIDFSNEKNEVEIRELQYIDSPFWMKKIAANKLKQFVKEINNVDEVKITGSSLQFTTLGRDGYIVFSNFSNSFSALPRAKAIIEELVILIVAYILVNIKRICSYLIRRLEVKKATYFLVAIVAGICISPNSDSASAVLLSVLFVVGTLEAVRTCFCFCFDFSKKDIIGFLENNKAYVILLLISVIGYLPLLSIPFSFQDEYMSFPGYRITEINYGYGRSIQSLMGKIFTFVRYDNIFYTRWCAAVFAILFTFLIYKWLLVNSKRETYSFLLALTIGGTNIVVDCIAYAVIMSYMYGIFMISMSYIIFEKYRKTTKWGCIYSLVFLFIALNAYQLVVPVLVFLFTIKLWHSSETFIEELKNVMKYAVIFILCTVLYFIYVKLATTGLGASARARSQSISSVAEMINKAQWFLAYIMKQVNYRILSIFTGNKIFLGNRMWAENALKYSGVVRKLINCLIYILPLSVAVVKARKKKSVLEGIYYIIAIPASFAIFLLLKESSYMTYYGYTLIVLLIFYYYNLIDWIISKTSLKLSIKRIVVIMVSVIICYNSYVYSLNGWVMPQVKSHDFVKSTLLNQLDGEKKEIYVIGTPNKWQANAYAIALTNNILTELGENYKEYTIKNTDVDGLVGILEQDVYQSVMNCLTDEEQNEFSAHYYFSEDYVQYHLIRDGLDKEGTARIKQLMEKGGLISTNEDKAIIIDLSWVYKN